LFGPAAEGVKWNYVNPVPVDEAAKNASLKIRIECFVLLLGVGADPVSAAEIAGIPEVTMKAITVGPAQSIPTNGHYRREVALP
jgi:hypothetical protein